MSATEEEPADPLRVGLFVSDFPIISESFVTTLAVMLLEAGHDLRILARDRAEASVGKMHDYVARSGIMDRFTRSDETGRLRLGTVLGLVRDQPRKAPTLAALWAYDRIAARPTMAVTRHLSGHAPYDVFHAQFATLGETAQRHRDYGTLRARALVVHLRGFDITRHARAHGPGVYARCFARAELFIANCEYFRQVAIGIGCPADRCVVVGSPIDTDRFQPPATPRSPDPGGLLRLVAVGRLVEKKGFGDCIDAVALLRDQGRKVRLDILGEGEMRGALERQIAAADLGDGITLHGAATQDRILAALHDADIGLAPSVTAEAGDQDAPVNTLKEKMATGLPVVATHHGGIPELVIDGENGYLVPERDPPALAAAIARLADAPDDRARFGQAGRRKVVETYERSIILEQTLAAYRQALANSETSS